MATRNGSAGRRLDDFPGRLSDLIGALPTPAEKSRIDNDLRVLIEYLEGGRKQLALLPAGGRGDRASIDRLRELMREADGDPVLSRVLGFPSNGRRAGRRAAALDDAARTRAREVAGELETLSREQVQHRLLDESYPVALLRQIGGELGIRIPSRASRSTAIDTIAGRLENRRGYEILRHGG